MFKKTLLLLFCIFTLSFSQYSFAQIVFNTEIGVLDSLHSDILNESRKIYVQLPDGYNAESSYKYPVVYILDGENLLNALYTVHHFYSGGFMPEMILIGISNDANRTRDLTTSAVDDPWINGESGGADVFMKFIEAELIPFVETKYPVTDYRTLIGHSYGGLFTINALINHSQLFENYIAIDPSLDWDDQLLLKQSKDKMTSENFEKKGLFMSLGGQLHPSNKSITIDNVMNDTSPATLFARSNIEFSALVKSNASNDLNFEWKFYPNDLHGTIPLPSIMDGLLDLFAWYQMEDTDKINSPDTTREELIQIIKHRERKLQNHLGYMEPPYPEELLNMSGYMNLDMQQPEKSRMYFEFAVEYYPESANSYDSLADYYASQNDFKNALLNVTKAYELSGDDYHKKRMGEFAAKL